MLHYHVHFTKGENVGLCDQYLCKICAFHLKYMQNLRVFFTHKMYYLQFCAFGEQYLTGFENFRILLVIFFNLAIFLAFFLVLYFSRSAFCIVTTFLQITKVSEFYGR